MILWIEDNLAIRSTPMTPEEMNAKRAEYEKTVKHPGKFQGQKAYAPYFYEQVLSGCFEAAGFPDGKRISYTGITEDDVNMFPELLKEHLGKFAAVLETDHGAVVVEIVDKQQIFRI